MVEVAKRIKRSFCHNAEAFHILCSDSDFIRYRLDLATIFFRVVGTIERATSCPITHVGLASSLVELVRELVVALLEDTSRPEAEPT